jgi:hypothetical protein
MIASGHLEFVSKKSVIHFELPASVITELRRTARNALVNPMSVNMCLRCQIASSDEQKRSTNDEESRYARLFLAADLVSTERLIERVTLFSRKADPNSSLGLQ